MKHHEKIESYLKYRDVNNLYGWATSKRLLVNGLEWAKETFQLNEVL